MNISGKKILIIGGAGFIGSHVVEALLKTDVERIVIYDNFARGKLEYIEEHLKDERCSFYPNGGDVREIDILNDAMNGFAKDSCSRKK